MKKILLLFTILFISVITTACINNLAIQELNNKAVNYMDKGDAETAICRLKSSLDLDNEIYQTHYNLAIAYNSLGQYKEAIEELNTVLKLKPDFDDVFYTLAIAKEGYAYSIIEKDPLTEEENTMDLSTEQISEFINTASDSVDTYNKYLAKKPDAKEKESINIKINELNEKIKEYTQIYDSATQVKSENTAEQTE